MKITYYGHSCFQLEIDDSKVLIDPFISGNPLADNIEISTLQPDFVLLSHGHQDHVLDTETIVKQSGAEIISTFEVATWFEKKGIEKVRAMNHGGNTKMPFGSVKIVNAIHSSSMPDGSYGGNPAGFVISGESKRIYYSGDTALTYDMKLVAEEGPVDVAFLCIGDHFTMGIEDAVRAAGFVNTQKVIGMHYNTFPPIEIDEEHALQAFSAKSIDLILPEIGKTFEI